jgi:hypothetical protein
VAALAVVGVGLAGSGAEAEISTVLAVGVLAAAVRNEIGKNQKLYAICHIQYDTQMKRFHVHRSYRNQMDRDLYELICVEQNIYQ